MSRTWITSALSLQFVDTTASSSHREARQRVLQLYKKCMRGVPQVVELYQITEVPVSHFRRRVHESFIEHKDVTDLSLIDRLLYTGQMEYQEFLLVHKTHWHVLGFLYPEELKVEAPESMRASGQKIQGASNFLAGFLKGESK